MAGMSMNELIRAAAGHVAPEPSPAAFGDPKRASWGKADGGEGRNASTPDEAGMSSLLRAHADDVRARAVMYERLASGGSISGRPIG